MVLLGLLLGVLGALGIVAIFWYYGRDLPDIESIDDYVPKQVTRVYSAEGELIDLWIDDDVIYRTVVPLEQIPRHMQLAMLAAEDSDFYQHSGLDLPGLLRAAWSNVRSGSFSQGASTITQQVVKNLILTPERTIRRKVQEVLLAFQLEEHLTKDEILSIYLNEVYFGGTRYGVEEAARYYFGRGVAAIDLPQAALLAGLVQSPARYNPYRHPEEALARRRYVLEQMWQKGFIEESAYREALDTPLALSPDAYPEVRCCRYFTETVRRQLYETLGRERVLTGGLQVYTTLRLDHQRAAQEAVRAALREYDDRHDAFDPVRRLEGDEAITSFRREHTPRADLEEGALVEVVVLGSDAQSLIVGLGPFEMTVPLEPFGRLNPEGQALEERYPRGAVVRLVANQAVALERLTAEPESAELRFPPSAEGAFVAIDPATRQVVALVGGYDYAFSPFNRATQAVRPTGSAFKPFIYGAALAAHLVTPATLVRDEPTPFRLPGGRSWDPQNDDGEYLGPIPLRTALARSRNVVSVRLLDELGLERARAFAQNAGIHTALTDNLTAALGSTEMPPLELVNAYATIASGGQTAEPILVTRVLDHRGQVVWTPSAQPEPGLDPAVTYVLTDLMTSVVERGTGQRASALGRPAAGKTGTTNEARDAWFVGFVPQLVAGGWVGFDDYVTLGRGEYGGRAALPIWLSYMQTVLQGQPVLDFGPAPPGVVTRRIDPETGLLATSGDPDAVDELFLEGTAPTRYAPAGGFEGGDPLWVGPQGTDVPERRYDDF